MKEKKKWLFGILVFVITCITIFCSVLAVDIFKESHLYDNLRESVAKVYRFVFKPGKNKNTMVDSAVVPPPNENEQIQNDEIKEEEKPIVLSEKEQILEEIKKISEEQNQIDAYLSEELKNKEHSPENPLIIVNPYGTSPLSAVVLFSTDMESKVSVRVSGKTQKADVSYSLDEFTEEHFVPIYGLYADCTNIVKLKIKNKKGKAKEYTYEITTDVLPDALSHERVRAYLLQPKKYQEGLNFTYNGALDKACKSAFDVFGDYRWYLDLSPYPIVCDKHRGGGHNNGQSVFLSVVSDNTFGIIMEFNFLGKLLNAYYSPYGQHHEIRVTDNLIYIGAHSNPNEDENFVCVFDRKTGEILHTLNYLYILQPERNQTKKPTVYYTALDKFHLNSVYPRKDETIIVSIRNQSTIVCNDLDGNIKWMICNPEGYYEYFKQFILKPVGENFEYPCVQHDVTELPDQDSDDSTIDILVFNNGHYEDDIPNRSSMIQYRINPSAMTVEKVWSYGEDRPEIYARIRGSAQLLDNGNRLGSFNLEDKVSSVRHAYEIEVTEDGTPVWECWRAGEENPSRYAEYRMDRYTFNVKPEYHSVEKGANLFF